MDCDDNDFQSQHFQLGGEDNINFPAGLCSFALPKFDLDDQLQLRFDNLVEPDNLLGIRAHERNTWIDEFSAGSSVIAFPSSDSESCSILRHNNVWSEAASTESVEMLLKAVGVDDMMNKTSVDSDTVGNQMETSPRKSDSNMEEMASAELSNVQIKCHNDILEYSGSAANATSDVSTYETQTVGKSGDETPVEDESLEGAGMISAEQCSHSGSLAFPPVNFFDEAKEGLPEDKDNGHQINEKPEDHLHTLDSVSGDQNGGFSEKDSSLSPSNTPPELSLPTPIEDVASADPNGKKFDNHVGVSCSREASETDRNIDVYSTDKLAHGSSLICSEHLVKPNYGVNDPVFLMEDCKEEVVEKKSDGLLDVVVNQMKMLNNTVSQDTAFEELDDVCSLEVYSHGKKEENAGDSNSPDDTNGQLVAVHSHGKSTDLTSVGDEEPEKSVTVMEGKKESDSCHDQSNSNVKEHPGSAVSQDNPFEELEDVCSVEVYSHENKEEDAGDSTYLAETSGQLVAVRSPGKSTELTSLGYDAIDKSVSLMEGKNEPASCSNQSDSNEKELPGSAVDKNSSGSQLSDIEEHTKLESHDHVSILPFETISNRSDNASIPSKENLDSSVHLESVEVQPSMEINDIKYLCDISAAISGKSDPVLMGNLGQEECGMSFPDNNSVPPAGTSDSVIQSMVEVPAKVHNISSASLHEASSDKEHIEESNVLASQGTNMLAPEKPEVCDQLMPDNGNVAIMTAEKMTLPVTENTVPSENAGEESFENTNILRSAVQECCNNIQTESLQQPVPDSQTMQCTLGEQAILREAAKDASCSVLDSAVDMPVIHAVPQTNDASVTMELDHPSELLLPETTPNETEKLSGSEAHPCECSQSQTCASESFPERPPSHSEVEAPSPFEPDCNSPTVISCSKKLYDATQDKHVNGNSAVSDERPATSNVDINPQEGKFVGVDPHESNTSEDDRGFSFKVGGQLPEFSEKDSSCNWENFPTSKTFEGTPSQTSCQHDSNALKGDFQGSQQVSSEIAASSVKKSSRKEKNKLGSTVKPVSAGTSASRRKSPKESPLSKKRAEKSGTSGKPSGSAPGSLILTVNKMQTEETQHPFVQGSNVKKSSESTVEMHKLPDLNTASATALFSQPFTDTQQVQLRAQIFVYGSLIQGVPPDESIMISAFGDPDGGRALWEGAWRAVAEKYYNQKSPICETPARPVIKAVDYASRCSPLPSKPASTPSYRSGAKSASPAIASPSVSLPPPVWTIPSHDMLSANASRVTQIDPSQAIPPMQTYLSPQTRQQTGTPPPWFTPSTSAPWTPTNNSSVHDASLQFPTLPVAASVRLPQLKESAAPHGSNIQLTPPSTYPISAGPPNSLTVQSVQTDATKLPSSPHKHSEQKPRKRKKDADSDAVRQLFSVPQSQSELNSVASSKPATITVPASPSARASSNCLVSTVPPIISPTHFQIVDTGRSEHKVTLSEETCSKIEQAKLQAEDAAAFATAAVRHSESIWSQLALQRNAGLLPEVEQKLASSAAAAAAAVAVAKAAAAAAKVAADSALQAKLMADEAVISSKSGTVLQSLESGQHSVETILSTFTPASIATATEKGNSSVISAAREGVRRRVEAATAAAKRAEILDAIVKAAELAAGAVSHAGAIVAMPDPLPFSLSDILDAGPQDYWKSQPKPVAEDLALKPNSTLEHVQSMKENAEIFDRNVDQNDQIPSNDKELTQTLQEENSLSSSKFDELPTENDPVVVPSENEKGGTEIDHSENVIQEGSIVEVASVENGLGVVWYSARVLNIKDGQAYVCYNTLHTNEGSEKLKEWIPLESDKESAPRIRTAQPSTTMKNEGTRKRRRAAVTTYVWSVGDRVDAWLRDGWCEGVIIEKSHLDDTKLTVRFSAGGESSIVRSWDLRPSLVWVNGQWTEWTRSAQALVKPSEGDTPREKRQKRRKADEQLSSSADAVEVTKTNIPIPGNLKANEECGPLALSAADKIFSAGQATREESNTSRMKRIGLQKEGSKVIFGVPKPGRRRKFMDVSKHCVVDKAEKVGAGTELVKSSKHLMPQHSHEFKNGSKVGARDRHVTNQKVKMLKSTKPQLTHTRSAAVKESTSTSLLGSSKDGVSSRGRFTAGKIPAIHMDNNSEKQSQMEVGSLSKKKGTTEDNRFSQLHHFTGMPADKPVSVTEAKLVDDKQIHAMETLSYEDDKSLSTDDNLEKNVPGSGEPRRSNRRIQPTSRLLEGLQSSMIISKIPSFSHDRGGRAIRRTGSASRGRSHG